MLKPFTKVYSNNDNSQTWSAAGDKVPRLPIGALLLYPTGVRVYRNPSASKTAKPAYAPPGLDNYKQ